MPIGFIVMNRIAIRYTHPLIRQFLGAVKLALEKAIKCVQE
jgi:hypothetical protein